MPPHIGKRYRDRYDVLARVGEGAFAQVFRARDLTTGNDVALKVLKDPYLTVKDVVERFQREVFVVASIDSPYVVGLTDFGISDDDFYVAMEFVEGSSLREVITAHQWHATEIHSVIGQIAHALDAAHRQNIVHRDLKPENVVLVPREQDSWQVKVLDFGFAKLPELERKLGLEPLTRKGYCFGTPQYLSPEQITGKPLDGRADLFALGVIVYEMLARRRPWDGDDPREIMMSVLKHLPPAVTKLPEGLGARVGELNDFLSRALAKSRDDRPADATAFFAELGQALLGDPATTLNGASQVPSAAPALGGGSQTIKLSVPVPAARRRRDPTEVTPAQAGDLGETIPFVTVRGRERELDLEEAARLGDTVKQPAFRDESDAARRLPSGYLPAPAPAAADAADTAANPTRQPSRAGRRALFAFFVLLVGVAAFYLGHSLK